jgi:Na+-transporting NADH:ubiquinone oxidoreductase subunit NqrE
MFFDLYLIGCMVTFGVALYATREDRLVVRVMASALAAGMSWMLVGVILAGISDNIKSLVEDK